jgi:hypothetical protein
MPSVKKSPAKKSPAKKSVSKSPAKKSVSKSPAKKSSYKNAKLAAGVAAALALAGAAGFGAYKAKQRYTPVSVGTEGPTIGFRQDVQRVIGMIKAKAAALRASIISRFQKKQITAPEAQKKIQEVAKEEDKNIQKVVEQAQQAGLIPEHGM